MKRSIAVIVCILSLSGYAQELLPLPYNYRQAVKRRPVLQQKAGAGDTLQLPFVDDFARSSVFPDYARYADTAGVYINNHFPVAPPTFNVATFDGLDEFGAPYDPENPFSRGLCDQLTSKPINLTGKNQVKMSFWWQAQGNAVPQVMTDSIQLLFLDNTGEWQLMWSQTGLVQTNDFEYEIISIDTTFVHNAFQFRFESYGNQSGMFGVWNIDYIYINENRSATDSVLNDIAFSSTPSSFLKKYWAMPFWQFFENPAAELNDSIRTTINNFKNDGSGLSYVTETYGDVLDENGGQTNFHTNTTNLVAPYERQKKVAGGNSDFSFINAATNATIIQNRFTMESNDQAVGDTVSGQVVSFSTNQNDTISSYTYLDDYYAYDDGTAEQAFKINTEGGIVVQKFNLNRPDTLYGISVHFPDNAYDYDSTQIVWMIWKNASGDYNIDDIIYDERGLISQADSVNEFVFYNFFEPVPLEDSFYIGYKQDDVYDILIGFDVNSDPGFEPIYFNTTGEWQRFQGVNGVLMIRPLFRPHEFESVSEMHNALSVSVFPNPGTGLFHFSEPVDEYAVYDMSGRCLQTGSIRQQHMDITGLQKGVYVVRLRQHDRWAMRRIVKK